MNLPLWFCLHFPHLPVDVFARHQPDESVIILTRQRIVSMNAAAADRGLRVGSSMNTALTISDDIVSFERDETRELACLQQLAQWALAFTPDVVVRPPCSLLLEVAGCLKLFQGVENLQRQIREGLAALGFDVVIGVNRTPASALCFAKAGAPDHTGTDVHASLAQLPVHHLQVEPAIMESLEQMGIARCGQLLDLPMDGLTRRFGVFFADYLHRLTGDRPDPQNIIDMTPRFRSDITFLSDIDNASSLVFPMKRLLQELEAFLQARQLQVTQFSFRLAHRHHGHRTFTVSLSAPDTDARMFLMLAQLQLEKIDSLPETDSLSLAASYFVPMEKFAGDLFEGTRFRRRDGTEQAQDSARAVKLINMMTARLGRDACFGLALANDHRPEHAWHQAPLGRRQEKNRAAGPGIMNARPAYLLTVPKRLPMHDGCPHISGPLELLAGPERIDAGWWEHDAVARDYFIARHNSGSLYWIYRDLHHHNWYLHGIFS